MQNKQPWIVTKAEYHLLDLIIRFTGHHLTKSEFEEVLIAIEKLSDEKNAGKRIHPIGLINNRSAEVILPVDILEADVQILQHLVDGLKLRCKFGTDPNPDKKVKQ